MNKSQRIRKIIIIWFAIIIAGIVLGTLLNYWDIYLPCIFREVTGWLCPGCGVTRMCKSIICLDFSKAFHYNPVVFLMLPILGIIFLNMSINYINLGVGKVSKPLEKIMIVMIGILVVFGVLRNLV